MNDNKNDNNSINNYSSSFVTSVDSSNFNKDKSAKNILIVLILFLIVGAVVFGMYKLFISNDNVSFNNDYDTYTIKSTETLDNFCNQVPLTQFLYHYELDSNNLEFSNIEYKPNYVIEKYYLVYEGYTFYDKAYQILKKGDNVICKNDEDNTSSLLSYNELNEKFNKLQSSEMKKFIKFDDRFRRYNLVSSVAKLNEIINKMQLSNLEIEHEINFIDSYYDNYLESLEDYSSARYSKSELLSVFNRNKVN